MKTEDEIAKEPQKWEYQDYSFNNDNLKNWDAIMNKYGDQGWEAYHVVRLEKWIVFFKRPKL